MKLKNLFILFVVFAVVLAGAFAGPAMAQSGQEDTPQVRGVFFFSPTCGHCELVINEHLPGIFAEFGGEPTVVFDETVPAEEVAFFEMSNGTLSLLFVNVGLPAGGELFVADSERLGLDRPGVPRLDIGDVYLVGSADVPAQLPGLIEQGLAEGGMDWPTVPGIEDALATIPAPGGVDEPIVEPEPDVNQDAPEAELNDEAGIDQETLPIVENDSVGDRLGRDPLGNGLAVVVLVGLLASLVAVPVLVMRGSIPGSPFWVVPVLAVVGIAVSIYLGSVEVSGAEAVCGPVGDCNAVQASEYSSILGIPIGILGLFAYGGLLLWWIMQRVLGGLGSDLALVAIAALAFGGTLFSVYLTFLEPFVIGATCMWCLTSAICIGALLWATAASGWAAFGRLGESRSRPVQ